jgi:glycosyltransferase involved in cell wall biosynthesis
MKVIVCQHGGRHGYAIPRMLETAGMLAALYTDSSAQSFLGKAARVRKSFARGRLFRLLQRRIEGIPEEKIFSTDWPLLSDIWAALVSPDENQFDANLRRHRALSKQMIRWGLKNADAIYVQNIEDYDFVRHAKNNKKKIIIDVNTSPLYHKIEAEKYSRYQSWGLTPDRSIIERREAHFKRSAGLADVLLCPSEWVIEGVITLTPEHARKIRICPYGSGIDYAGQTNSPVPGQIFFAGSNALMKGLPDLARAADILKQRYPQMDFRIAGLIDTKIQKMSECRSLHFVGRLSRGRMEEEYLAADMFVLPTHSEGLAGAVLEAIAAGCPVITTKCAGIGITHMVDGILVPPGEVNALVGAIEKVYKDRKYRNTLASHTLALATNYTLDAWRKRLADILREL